MRVYNEIHTMPTHGDPSERPYDASPHEVTEEVSRPEFESLADDPGEVTSSPLAGPHNTRDKSHVEKWRELRDHLVDTEAHLTTVLIQQGFDSEKARAVLEDWTQQMHVFADNEDAEYADSIPPLLHDISYTIHKARLLWEQYHIPLIKNALGAGRDLILKEVRVLIDNAKSIMLLNEGALQDMCEKDSDLESLVTHVQEEIQGLDNIIYTTEKSEGKGIEETPVTDA